MANSATQKNVVRLQQPDSKLWNGIWCALEEAEWFVSNGPFKLRDSPASRSWLSDFAEKIREAREAVLSMQE